MIHGLEILSGIEVTHNFLILLIPVVEWGDLGLMIGVLSKMVLETFFAKNSEGACSGCADFANWALFMVRTEGLLTDYGFFGG